MFYIQNKFSSTFEYNFTICYLFVFCICHLEQGQIDQLPCYTVKFLILKIIQLEWWFPLVRCLWLYKVEKLLLWEVYCLYPHDWWSKARSSLLTVLRWLWWRCLECSVPATARGPLLKISITGYKCCRNGLQIIYAVLLCGLRELTFCARQTKIMFENKYSI